eukprot:c9277_g1_i1.p1 GENE.c9277_g1_i1~~c9277_g1_i1.p1  ORF type:complete len:132 (-),score=20.83 c9277_g1_i1:105-476(-)
MASIPRTRKPPARKNPTRANQTYQTCPNPFSFGREAHDLPDSEMQVPAWNTDAWIHFVIAQNQELMQTAKHGFSNLCASVLQVPSTSSVVVFSGLIAGLWIGNSYFVVSEPLVPLVFCEGFCG